MEKGDVFVISAPSGSGKTTICRMLVQRLDNMELSISYTTRPRKRREEDGKDYHFIDESAFRDMIGENGFAEWAEVHGNLYGTSVTEIDLARAAGKSGVLFDVDYQGARQIKEKFPHAIGVFILPPSMEELRRRLDGRASDDAESRQRRFDRAREEIGHYPFFDYMIVNDELQRALTELRGVVLAEGCRQWRVAARAESLLQQ